MTEERNEALPEGAVGARREATIDALMEHFANDEIEVEEFEERVEAAHRATDSEALRVLLADLPGGGLPARMAEKERPPASRDRPRVTAAAHHKEREVMVGVMGGGGRTGRWTPARVSWVVGVMGGQQLDFREANFAPGVTEVRAFHIMGGMEIIVPPGVRVETNGFAFMGGYNLSDEEGGDPYEADYDAPVLRITGAVVMGGVEVTFRYSGESKSEAKQRRRLRRTERRRLERGR